MSENRAIGTKDVEELREQSIQPRAKEETLTGFTGLLGYLASGTSFVAPWWSPQRDLDLSTFWKGSDKMSGAMALLTSKVVTVPVRVEPRDTSLKKHVRDAEDYTIRLNEESEFGQGLTETMSKCLEDWWGSDNGMFIEIIGDGDKDGPIEGPALGVAHLDSHRCTRISNPEFPVLYQKPDGGRAKLHWTRVAFAADMPSAREEMNGVGFSAVSRAINAGQNLVDIATYKQEKLGSRPLRGILIGKGIPAEAILDAMAVAGEEMDNRGFSIFSQLAVLGSIPPDAALDLLSLVSLPEGFDEETSTRLGMFTLALAWGVPIRWIWPAAVSGATKADAMYQHIAGLGGGIGRVLKTITMLLGGDPRGTRHGRGKFLPEHLRLVFDFQDDEQDRMRAEIATKRSTAIQSELEAGVIDTRVAREKALSSGDIDQAQFESLELGDGRLSDGSSVLSLFHRAKEPWLSWLDLGVPNPLSTTANDAIDMLAEINAAAVNMQDIIANSGHATRRKQAKQALAALNQLKSMYAPLAQQSIQSEIMSRFGRPTQTEEEEPTTSEEAPEETPEETPGTPTETMREALEPEEKALGRKATGFDYTVGVGEIIGGELARGEQGRFINAADMMDQIRAGMMARLAGAETGLMQNTAADARAENRAAVAEALGMDPALLDGLAGMKTGETPLETEAALADMGLATRNPDGSISMSSSGRSLLSAANSGDVDSAEQAKASAGAGGGGGGGGGGADPEAERRSNLESARDKLDERIDPDVFDALVDFADGEDLSDELADQLAEMGLVEIDADGNARFTSEGSTFINAAGAGDLRQAKDSLSRASEAAAGSTARSFRDLVESMMTSKARADALSAASADLTAQANTLKSEIKALPPNSPEARDKELLRSECRLAAARLDDLANEYLQHTKAIKDHLTDKQPESIFARALRALGLKQPIQPVGLPLAPWEEDTVEITEADIENTIAAWNAKASDPDSDLLPAAENILEASAASEEEIAQVNENR